MVKWQPGARTKQFNLRRFLTLVALFAGVAALMLFTRPNSDPTATTARPFPLYDLRLTGKAARGTLILNGVSIAHHETGPEERSATIALTPWMKNGANRLHITTSGPMENTPPDLKVTLITTQPSGKADEKQLFHMKKPAARQTIITATGLPEWRWMAGEATFHDHEEIKSAVRRLHDAFANKDTNTIRNMEAPLFADMETLTGREGLARRQYRNEVIEKGKIEPLRRMIIVPFDNGRIMRVTNPDGEAPIRIYFNYGGGGKAILTGQFWSKINSEWKVVR